MASFKKEPHSAMPHHGISPLLCGRIMSFWIVLVVLLMWLTVGSFAENPISETNTVPWIDQQSVSKEPRPVIFTSSVIKSTTLWEDSPDIAITDDPTITQSENSVFIDPNNPMIVLNSNNSSDWPVTSIYGNAAWVSTDGGQTWTGDVEGPVPETRGDPATAIGLNGRMYVGNITEDPYGQGVAWSDNLGATWTHTQLILGYLPDKNHLWVDNSPGSPYEGNLYSAWTNMISGSPSYYEIEICRSTDQDTSWSSPMVISDEIDDYLQQGVNIQTGPNGEVYAVWAIYPISSLEEYALGFAKSLDGGQSWLPAFRIITNIRGHRSTALGGGKTMRHNSFPSMTVDQQTGQIYVVWTNIGIPGVNTGDPDIYMITSLDGGDTWSTPVRVNQDEIGNGKDQYFPWIACDPANGDLVCIFYDSRNFPGNDMVETFVAVSLDHGATWEDFRVSDAAWSGDGISGFGGNYAGDYLGIDILDGRVYPVWSDDRTGNMLAYVSPFEIETSAGQIWVDGTYGDDITGNGSVDSPYQTIGKGISEATDGDTVQVQPGTYIENIDFGGKAIMLNGFYGPDMTILKPATPNVATIKMTSGEPAGTVFSGFTVRDGGDCNPFLIDGGAEPLITNNIFTFNIRGVVGYNKAVIKTANSNPTFTRNRFYKNGGISCIGIWSSTATILNNTFEDNSRGFFTISGQGVAKNNIVTNSWEYGVYGTWTELDYNDVWQNNPNYSSANPGPGSISADPLYIDAAEYRYYVHYYSPCIDAGDPSMIDPDHSRIDMGALHALYVPYGPATIQEALTDSSELPVTVLVYPGTYNENIDFWGRHSQIISVEGAEVTFLRPDVSTEPVITMTDGENEKTLVSGFTIENGGDYYTVMIGSGAQPLFRNNIFRNNIVGVPGDNKSVVRTDNSDPFFYRNLFHDNGGISCIAIYSGDGEIVNNTFDDNNRGFLTISGKGIAKNNIVTNSSGYGIHGNFTELDYNDVWNNNPDYNLGNPGPHDISVDPLYDEVYGLRSGSACIDAGDPAVRYDDPDGTRNDMGYLPFVRFYVMVPLHYSTIQEAIENVPDENATIDVAPGVYTENIDFLGKTLRLIGAGNTESGDTTFLEPAVAGNPTVLIMNGEGEGTELSGFTIRDGGDTYTIKVGNNASPLIAHNVFYDNILCSDPWDDDIENITDKASSEDNSDDPDYKDELWVKKDISPEPPPPPPCGYNKVIIQCLSPSGTPVIDHNLFYHNGGISCVGIWTNAYAEIINNTFDDNPRGFLTISVLGGIAYNNCVTNSDDYGIYGYWTDLDYNNVWNNNPNYQNANPGSHSISADPLYVDRYHHNYYLLAGSPCIDAGNPDPQYNDPDGSIADIGAFMFWANKGLVKVESQKPPYSLSQNYPNPFNPTTTIGFALADPGHIEIAVYNVLGQNVRTLIDGFMEAGEHSVIWDGRDNDGRSVASGIYLYRIDAKEYIATKKMLLLK